MNEEEIYICPNCNEYIYINLKDLNCRIFRHASYKKNINILYNPHATKLEIEKDLLENKIYGCGKPFRITQDGKCIICDYI